jgi:hypothetical protein
MRVHEEARRKVEWTALHGCIAKALNRFGQEYAAGKGDYLLVEDDWGDYRLRIEVQNLNFLHPDIVRLLRSLLAGYPDWEIMYRVDVIGKEKEWPAMGLIIHDDGIIDDLKREFLPSEFRNVAYEGTKLPKS